MKRKNSVAIACASAFWGDTPYALRQLLREPNLNYVVFDYLSEVTMTLLARFKKKDPSQGYIPDFFTDVIEPHLKTCKERGLRLLCNAGGMNPSALKQKIEAFAESQGLKVKVICVEGDDLLSEGRLKAQVTDMNGRPWEEQALLSANAYLGAPALAEALKQGADVVLCGRCADSSLVLAPLVHEFGWEWTNYDLLAQGSLGGHVLECGTQCTGGNFTDWEEVSLATDVGFPILRFEPTGEFVVTKAPDTGGLITRDSVAEQILYEIGDPGAYVLPDVICDFRHLRLEPQGENSLKVSGARGREPTASYKVSATAQKAWKISATAFMAGGDSRKKGTVVGRQLFERCDRLLKENGNTSYLETRLEVLGSGDDGVLLRLSAAHGDPQALDVLAKEIAPAATSMAPGLCNLLGGRAQATPRIALISLLVEKSAVEIKVNGQAFQLPASGRGEAPSTPAWKPVSLNSMTKTLLPLYKLACARSGDKGNHVNIGLIARRPEYFEILKSEMTPEKVAEFFTTDFDDPRSTKVRGWELPGFHSLNFLIENCLGGGGAYSLKIDPQGKAFAQRLLQMRIAVPVDTARSFSL
jgi:hypothetical protein